MSLPQTDSRVSISWMIFWLSAFPEMTASQHLLNSATELSDWATGATRGLTTATGVRRPNMFLGANISYWYQNYFSYQTYPSGSLTVGGGLGGCCSSSVSITLIGPPVLNLKIRLFLSSLKRNYKYSLFQLHLVLQWMFPPRLSDW